MASLKGPAVLLVKLSSLGDVIHTLPVVADILAAHPGAQVDWVVEPGFAPLVRRAQGIGRVLEHAHRRWRRQWWQAGVRAEKRAFADTLHARAYDWVLDLQGLTKSALVARQAHKARGGQHVAMANRTAGSGYEAPTRWLADQAITLPTQIHAVDRGRLLAARALGYEVQGVPRYALRTQPVAAAAGAGAGAGAGARPLMVLVHGTSRADKCWPVAHWQALGQRLIDAGWRLALPQGNDEEAARAQALVTGWGAAQAEVWPRMALDALVDHMAAARACIGVDSGLSHLAVALDLAHVQLYNFPTAWRTGPQPQHSAGAAPHLVSVGGAGGHGVPSLDEVWAAWLGVARARGWAA